MTALILQATPFVEVVAQKLQTVYLRVLHALDAFAEARMRNAVPEWKQRKAQREINRFRRLMHPGRNSAGARLSSMRTNMVGGMARGVRWTRLQSFADRETSAPCPYQAVSGARYMSTFMHDARMHLARAFAHSLKLLSRLRASMLETRRQRTLLEMELFRGRYHLSSKNDDDLPIVH
jgi:hypothetical protein